MKNEVLLCPPYVTIRSLVDAFNGTFFKTGAQNVSQFDEGAFTGEVSISMLKDAGCSHVIVGHSERREIYGETDKIVAEKTTKVLSGGLVPVICVGEKLETRKAGKQQEVVKHQLDAVLPVVSDDDAENIVIAYEPVWAIGTGETATPEQAQSMHNFIRAELQNRWGSDTSAKIKILYGGSMKPGNAKELLSQPDVDGGLIGGASLEPGSFSDIIKAAEELS